MIDDGLGIFPFTPYPELGLMFCGAEATVKYCPS